MSLHIFTSTVADGSMKSPDMNFMTVLPERTAFLQEHSISPDDTTLLQLIYETDDFRRYASLTPKDKGDGITRRASIISDALVVTRPNHAILLPLADCIGAVIHDPAHNVMMVSHLGRHNLEQNGGVESIRYLTHQYDSKPEQLTVWLSPAAGAQNYPLYSFNNRGLHDVAMEQLVSAGVLAHTITASPIDTTIDTQYFSHSQFLQKNRPSDGRFAVVAMLRD